jgi:hypothetical protein
MRDFAQALRALVAWLLARRPATRRNVAILVLGLLFIPVWQYRLTKPDVTHSPAYGTTASTGVHSEPKFFFFLKHLDLYPLMTVRRTSASTRASRSGRAIAGARISITWIGS